ncbi:MAG: hypothetical protein ABIV06_12350 [Thermoanaerobaculia bacterium]
MRLHEQIDLRSLELARAVVARIDADPERHGLERARKTCSRWLGSAPAPALEEWSRILVRDWTVIRSVLLDEGAEGQRLRQSSPFTGVLTPSERWEILRRFRDESSAA